MAAILDNLITQYATDQVAVFTSDFIQLFRQARAIKASVKPESKIMEHPVETGATITDHIIILPTEIELSLLLNSADYPNVYQTIQQIKDNATLLTVQTKTGIYPNQLIMSIPHEEDPALYTAITVSMKLKQVLFSSPQYNIVPRRPKDTVPVDKGMQPSPVVPSNTTVAQDIAGAIGII